ncbi:Glycosyltransferase, GT2 family [Dyella jiangningensis]|uniref:glycosyltransferase n=1 Tax=Dyella sp. AtDHG13 TaxID=1938897 RepID=UPI000889E5FA|nr:glycosyltransferase [Dyella sp. AtDHG13]PXV59672.1 GT2 family glycosyltransferase [Dyella sp. AtDHG13]SDJ27678.1 Glycosyltransferase, GT2 family [Dyella jiangningensis]
MTDTDALRRLAAATTLVTVTYADRIHFLGELLRRAFDQEGMERAVIVSNASRSNLALLEEKWGSRVQIIRLTENTGSANGYAVGIQAALDGGAHYLWLMDDDNAPKQGALAVLHEQLERNSAKLGASHAAVLGFRRDHQADIAAGVPMAMAIPPRSSFLGFHYRQIPFKVWRRICLWPYATKGLPERVALPYGPYGGLLAARQLFENIGLPKREFVLYADDTEYTYRITASGGAVELICPAELDDLEGSWNLKSRYRNSFLGWLMGGSDLRAFYGARNQVWFDQNVWLTSRFEYRLNQAIYIGLLCLISLRVGRAPRLRLLRRAISCGRASTLGVDSKFTLS